MWVWWRRVIARFKSLWRAGWGSRTKGGKNGWRSICDRQYCFHLFSLLCLSKETFSFYSFPHPSWPMQRRCCLRIGSWGGARPPSAKRRQFNFATLCAFHRLNQTVPMEECELVIYLFFLGTTTTHLEFWTKRTGSCTHSISRETIEGNHSNTRKCEQQMVWKNSRACRNAKLFVSRCMDVQRGHTTRNQMCTLPCDCNTDSWGTVFFG